MLDRIETKIEYPTDCKQDKDKIIKKLIVAIHNIINNFGIRWEKIAGIGAAAPDLIDKKGTMFITPDFGWRNTLLREILKNIKLIGEKDGR